MSKRDEMQFDHVGRLDGKMFEPVPPFPVPLGNVVRGFGKWTMIIGLVLTAWFGLAWVYTVMTEGSTLPMP